jgi:Fe-S-cluster containining protein
LDFCLDRKSAFSFTCHACGHCCTGKVIMAGPHEILGMARLLGISTTEFLALNSDNGGTTLRAEADGRCVFVTPSGCRVHPRRPLVCRLYPLGRMTDETGVERFALYPKEPTCEAETGLDGTIETFLDSQGVRPYFEWARLYGEVYRRMMGILERLDVEGQVEGRAAGETPGPEKAEGPDRETDRVPLSSWQDIDASLAEYCAARGLAVPEGIDDAITLHLRAMTEWLDELEGASKP